MKSKIKTILIFATIGINLIGCAPNKKETNTSTTTQQNKIMNIENQDTVTIAGGCFWCVEAVYDQLKGVEKVTSGYSGGVIKNPAYREVCMGTTGHAEVIQIVYNTNEVSFKDILEVFFTVHDPTTLNRQGADVGTQYRSAIFYHNDEQKTIAEDIIKRLNESGAFNNKIVTEVSPFTVFYPAENYHQDYYAQHGSESYCQMVVRPKVEKFKKAFHDKLK